MMASAVGEEVAAVARILVERKAVRQEIATEVLQTLRAGGKA